MSSVINRIGQARSSEKGIRDLRDSRGGTRATGRELERVVIAAKRIFKDRAQCAILKLIPKVRKLIYEATLPTMWRDHNTRKTHHKCVDAKTSNHSTSYSTADILCPRRQIQVRCDHEGQGYELAQRDFNSPNEHHSEMLSTPSNYYEWVRAPTSNLLERAQAS